MNLPTNLPTYLLAVNLNLIFDRTLAAMLFFKGQRPVGMDTASRAASNHKALRILLLW